MQRLSLSLASRRIGNIRKNLSEGYLGRKEKKTGTGINAKRNE